MDIFYIALLALCAGLTRGLIRFCAALHEGART